MNKCKCRNMWIAMYNLSQYKKVTWKITTICTNCGTKWWSAKCLQSWITKNSRFVFFFFWILDSLASHIAKSKLKMDAVREFCIDRALKGKCRDCGPNKICKDDMYFHIPADAPSIRKAFSDIGRQCTTCEEGWVCIKIIRATRTAVATDHPLAEL